LNLNKARIFFTLKIELDMIYITIYTYKQEDSMQTARLFMNGRSQAVRLPKEFQFNSENVYIQRVGEAVMLFPVDREWEVFLHGLNNFSDGFMSEGRYQGIKQEREEL
jgi:antitoxin VapB